MSLDVSRLHAIDWDFRDAKTNSLTHGLHPYPAKYIPQIPNALIQALSESGETVGDIFCGSGTTLVEALVLKRRAVGVDANPLAALISRVKTTLLSDGQLALLADLAQRAESTSKALAPYQSGSLFGKSPFRSSAQRPEGDDLPFWFQECVIEELAEAKLWCDGISDAAARDAALVAFSSIVVSVSRQDSDTRYVRRDKTIEPGETLRRFGRALRESVRALAELARVCERHYPVAVISENIIDHPAVPLLDLIVCSPPYPNAYSYHLYHRTRMLWLRMDQTRFKREEIGSHRKYSAKGKNAATAATFREEMTHVFSWLRHRLRRNRYACLVVGDSTIRGQRIQNADLLTEAASANGFTREAAIVRTLHAQKKAFNPKIGKIKTETILVLRNQDGVTA